MMAEVCAECKEKKVQQIDDNQCLSCSKYAVKYYCNECQNKHQCNDGFWESKQEVPKIEIIFRKFSQAVILEMDRIVKDLVNENASLKKTVEELKNK